MYTKIVSSFVRIIQGHTKVGLHEINVLTQIATFKSCNLVFEASLQVQTRHLNTNWPVLKW
jgi:hypothetical protein